MIAIVDYGMGNLRSVQKAVERVGGDARIVQTPAELTKADKVILPGVGAFRDAIAALRAGGLDAPIVSACRGGVPFMGICLGLQLLFEVSHEYGEHKGLGVLAGKVVRFDFGGLQAATELRVPQIGWNQIRDERNCPLLAGLPRDAYMYFAHSFHVVPADPAITATTTDYGYRYTSAVWKDNIFAVQFHPEKSQALGLRLLENFVRS